jgi:SAM-dependent methyltransferase
MTIDFDCWASTYDATRGVSPSVLKPLLAALGPAPGRTLLDIGGGTGNFTAALAAEGFAATLCDLAPEMARHAAAKALPCVIAADAHHLPFTDRAFDCAVSVNVARHLADRPAAFREARRVLRDGPFVMKVSSAETQRGDWLIEYFPRLLDYQPPYQPEEQLEAELRSAGFASVAVSRFVYEDALDGSFQALKRFPERLLDGEAVRNTAVFKRLPADQLDAGLARLHADITSGAVLDVVRAYGPLAREYGDGSVFVARP